MQKDSTELNNTRKIHKYRSTKYSELPPLKKPKKQQNKKNQNQPEHVRSLCYICFLNVPIAFRLFLGAGLCLIN